MSAKTSSVPLGLLFAVLAFAIFSGHDAIVKAVGSRYSVFQILFFAGLFAFIPITLMMSTDKAVDNFIPHRPWLIVARSVFNLIAMSAAFYAFSVLPLAEVYALIFATPLLITALAVPLLGETIRLRRGIAILIGLAGVMVVLRPGTTEYNLGHAAALTTAVGGAFGAVIVRKIGNTERSAVIILYPMLASLITMAALQPLVFIPPTLTDMTLMALVGLMAIVAQFFIIAAYRNAPATIIAPMQYSQILWAILYGYLFFDELPDMWVGIGSAIVIASGLYIVLRESKLEVSQTSPVLRNPNMRPDAGPSPRPKLHEEIFTMEELGQ